MSDPLIIGDSPISIEDALAVGRGTQVQLSEQARARIAQSRAQIEDYTREHAVYGFSRGFGQHQDIPVPLEGQRLLQRNLITTHAVSFGEPADHELVRMTMLFRINSLAMGHSGARLVLVEHLIKVLNHPDLSPYVPLIGSLGASGDLSSMSHIGLTLIGEGRSYLKRQGVWELVPSSEALKACEIEPIELASKEGLALNNGMQFSTAQLLLITDKLHKHIKLATRMAGCMTEAMFGSDEPYLPEIHQLRPYRGQQKAARLLLEVFEESKLRLAHPPEVDPNIQDPYSSRCLPQVIGPFFDAVDQAYEVLRIEMNSATDNPLVFEQKVISGGNFHGMPIAIVAANLFNAYCAVVKILQSILARLVDKDKNRLGVSCLIDFRSDPSVSSGMMIAEYSAHAIGNLILSRNSTAFLHSVTSASCQEDHVSHAPTILYNLQSTLPFFENFLGIFAAMTTRIYEVIATPESHQHYKSTGRVAQDAELTPGKIGRQLIEIVQPYFPLEEMIEDHYFRDRLERITHELINTDHLYEALC